MSGEPKGYFEKESDSIMPPYNINKIIITDKNLRIMCSIDKDRTIGYDSWLASSDLYKYINFYFLLVGDLDRDTKTKLYYPKTRVKSFPYGEGESRSF